MAPPNKSAKRKKSSPSSQGSAKKPKGRNFTPQEDVLISRAFVNCSTNPISGVGQKADDFWMQVKEKYEELYLTENIQEEDGKVERTHHAIMNRFQRFIQRGVNSFNP